MRKIIVVALIVGAGLLSSAAAASTRPRHEVSRKCPPANRGVVLADAQAVVYKAGTIVEEGLEGVFGCAYRARKPYHLGRTDEASEAGSVSTYPITLAGPVVAYDEATIATYGRHSHEIWVRNLATGKLIHRMPNGSPAEARDVGLGETTAIVVKSDGSVAWIVRAGFELGGIQVRSMDETGSHLLSASAEIDPGSLALAGSTLYWMQAGTPMSATLR